MYTGAVSPSMFTKSLHNNNIMNCVKVSPTDLMFIFVELADGGGDLAREGGAWGLSQLLMDWEIRNNGNNDHPV